MNSIIYLLSSFLFTYFLISIILKNNFLSILIDYPNKRKIHSNNTPAIGGVVIFFSLFLFFIFHLIFDYTILFVANFNVLFFCTTLFFLLGLLDDIYDLNVYYKLIFQVLICSIAVFTIDFIHDFRWHFFDIYFSDFFSYFFSITFMLIVINGINFLDGVDGLLSILGILMLGSFYFLFAIDLFHFLSILIGSLLAIFRFNKYPAKIFLGDSGSLLLGWILALLAFIYTITIESNNSIKLPMIILALPIIDLLYVVIIRFFVNDNLYNRIKNIFIADRKHLHYKILDKTISPVKTVVYMSIFNFLFLMYLIIDKYL